MKTTVISSNEYEDLKISNLPTCPTADTRYGGYGYSASQMKQAFDALALFAIDKLNLLIADIKAASPSESICAVLKTGIKRDHSFKNLLEDVTNGNLAVFKTC